MSIDEIKKQINMMQIIPLNDIEPHVEDSTCKCCPSLIMENGEMILVHNSFDRREQTENK